ncbi:MAG: hypothetical protein LBC04_04475 [Holosporaceae bacterium]|nr:hypothetical protein [Holosporaceae bacterium]
MYRTLMMLLIINFSVCAMTPREKLENGYPAQSAYFPFESSSSEFEIAASNAIVRARFNMASAQGLKIALGVGLAQCPGPLSKDEGTLVLAAEHPGFFTLDKGNGADPETHNHFCANFELKERLNLCLPEGIVDFMFFAPGTFCYVDRDGLENLLMLLKPSGIMCAPINPEGAFAKLIDGSCDRDQALAQVNEYVERDGMLKFLREDGRLDLATVHYADGQAIMPLYLNRYPDHTFTFARRLFGAAEVTVIFCGNVDATGNPTSSAGNFIKKFSEHPVRFLAVSNSGEQLVSPQGRGMNQAECALCPIWNLIDSRFGDVSDTGVWVGAIRTMRAHTRYLSTQGEAAFMIVKRGS